MPLIQKKSAVFFRRLSYTVKFKREKLHVNFIIIKFQFLVFLTKEKQIK